MKLSLAIIGVVVAAVAASWYCSGHRVEQRSDPSPTPDSPLRPSPVYSLNSALVESGWDVDTAAAADSVCGRWISEYRMVSPDDAGRQFKYLANLARYPAVMPLLRQHPELAGLLAGLENPLRAARVLADAGENYNVLSGLFVQHCDPEDAARLADALDEDAGLIAELIRRGMAGAELLFLSAVGPEAREYRLWLRDELSSPRLSSNDELASFQQFLLDEGPNLRRQLGSNDSFGARFRTELWPKLARVVRDTDAAWSQYSGEPHLWKLLALPEGEQLLRDWGRLPLLLLFEDGAYPHEQHARIIKAMRDDDRMLLQALVKCRGEPLFRKLLSRPLPEATLRSAYDKLLRADKAYPDRLAYYDRLGDAALSADLGPPPPEVFTYVPFYDALYVGKKWLDGREVGALEAGFAFADVALCLVPEAKLAGKLGTEGGKKAAATVLKGAGKQQAIKQFPKIARAGVRITADEAVRVAERMAERGIAEEMAHLAVTQTLMGIQVPIRNALVKRATVEVTGPVRLLFKYSGLSPNSFKRLTGLEARLFMRGDARVFVRMDKTLIGQAAGALGKRITEETAEEILRLAKDAVPGSIALADMAWRKNVAAWWLTNAAGLTEILPVGDGSAP